MRVIDTRRKQSEAQSVGQGNEGGWYVVGYRVGRNPSILTATGSREQAEAMREIMAAQLVGYEAIVVEKCFA